MANPELSGAHEAPRNDTEKLVSYLQDILNTFGEFGEDINAEAGVIRRTGFLDTGINYSKYPCSLVIITEKVDENNLSAPSVYQIDSVSKVTPHLTKVISEATDSYDARMTMEYTLPNPSQELLKNYKNPQNAELIESLLSKSADSFVHADENKKQGKIRKKISMRKERKEIESSYMQRGYDPGAAKRKARILMAARAIQRY